MTWAQFPTPSGATEVRLRRSAWVRLVAAPYQFFFTGFAALFVWAIYLSATTLGSSTADLLKYAGPGVVEIALLWLPTLTAWARVDGDGLRWRHFVPRTVPWADVRAIEFGRKQTGVANHTATYSASVTVVTNTGSRRIGPIYGCGVPARTEFAHGLLAEAQRHHVPWTVRPDGAGRWDFLLPPTHA